MVEKIMKLQEKLHQIGFERPVADDEQPLAERLQHGLDALDERRLAGRHDKELPGFGGGRSPQNRCSDVALTEAGMGLLQPPRLIDRDGAAGDVDRPLRQPGEDAVRPEDEAFHRIVGRQHGDDRLPRRRLGGGVGDRRAILAQRLGPALACG